MKFSLRISCLLAALVFFCLSSTLQAQTLKGASNPKKVWVGNIVSDGLLANPTGFDGSNALPNLQDEYNVIVLENAMKMGNVLPTSQPNNIHGLSITQLKNTLRTGNVDKFINNSAFNGFRKRGHAMIWFNQAPGWLNSNAPNWSAQQVFDFSRKYIKALSQVCGNSIAEWDVINEAIADDSPNGNRRWRPNTWYRKANDGSQTTYGTASYENYIRMLFVWAREAQPNARLFYNDYAIENFGTGNDSKNKFMREKFKAIKDCGAPIDGIGFQSHFICADMVSANGTINTGFINSVKSSMEDLDDAGLEVAITELDIRICNGDRVEATQEAAYYEFVRMAYAQPNCWSVLMWGQRDERNWIHVANYEPFTNCFDPSIFEGNNYDKKNAYTGVLGAIQSQPNRNSFGYPSLNQGSGQTASCGGGGATPAVTSVTVSDDVVRGGTANVTINYSAGNNQDIYVVFQRDNGNYQVFSDARRNAVSGANKTITIPVNIPANTPVANNEYQFQVMVTPDNGNYSNRLANRARNNVDVINGASSQLIANGTYYMKKSNSNHYIYAVGSTNNLRSRTNTNGNNSRWTFAHLGNDEYRITNVGFNQRMEVPNGNTGQGQRAARTSYTGGGDHLIWKAIPLGNGVFQFLPKHDQARALDIYSSNANVVHVWNKNTNNQNQRFSLISTSPAQGVIREDLNNDFSSLGGEVFEPMAFPNPTEGLTTIQGLLEGETEITVFSVTGAKLISKKVVATNRTQLDLRTLKAGIYLISLTQGDEHRLLRISKH